MAQQMGRQSLQFENPPWIISSGCIAGTKEGEGPIGHEIDLIGEDDNFGCDIWEEAESTLQKEALTLALGKAGLKAEELRYLFAGDLLGQSMATSFGLQPFEIPLFGLYGACSTAGESLALAAMTVAAGYADLVGAVTSSHFASAEKQFRFPLEYANQRPLCTTWTVTGAGAFLLGRESGKKQNFTCNSDKRIRAVGFLSNDFIYGEADAADVSKSRNGMINFPITKIHIVDIDGKTIKEYQKSGRYIMDTEIKGSILEMTLGKRSGNKIHKTNTKDYIRYKEEEAEDAVTLTSKYTDTYWTQLYFKFPNYIYIQVVPDLLLTKIMVNEDDVTLKLSNSGEQVEQYYVYASGVQKAVYTNLTEAIARAYEERGNVIDSKENILWKCIYADYAQVAGMDNVIKTGTDSTSLAGCLSMIAAVNGKEVTPGSINIEKDNIEELMKKYSGYTTRNLTGCTVDEILYYVSQGSPVLAKISSSRYVIVMSYNATKIRYLDPVTGQSTAVSRTEVTNRLEKTGKVFYSYLIH